jgi:hypothetical protein
MKLAACIKTTEDYEIIDRAIDSLLALPPGAIATVMVESPAGVHAVSADRSAALEQRGIKIKDTGNIDDDLPSCEAVLFVHPQCSFTPVAFQKLTKTMRDTSSERFTHYSVSSILRLSGASIWHGFLVILAMIDLAWSAFDRFKHPLDTDLCLVHVIHIGTRRFLADRPWYQRLSFLL